MSVLTNGYTNGLPQIQLPTAHITSLRFSDIPTAIDIPVSGADVEEAVELDLETLLDDPTELCTLLENENAARNLWMVISQAYAKQHKIDHAIEILNRGLHSLSRGVPREKIGLWSLLSCLYLWKSREAPRVAAHGEAGSDARTKEHYLQKANGALTEASRLNPSFPPLFLARGILSLLRASLQPPSKILARGAIEQSERTEMLRQALKCFDDALRVSAGRNMMALLGRGRTLFALAKYAEALDCYHEVLSKMPDLHDPDPRIGIGCCYWQLKFPDEAKEAWDRALELNPQSQIALVLLGLYYVYQSSRTPPADPKSRRIYKRAMTVYTQQAFRHNRDSPLACTVFAHYFVTRRSWEIAESLARKAIELTDVNAIASDAWLVLARRAHQQGASHWSKGADLYTRADNARGAGDRGYLPARFGAAQIQVLNGDIGGAKFRLEKIIQQTKSTEAMVLLGNLYAEEATAPQLTGASEDTSAATRKAIALLEAVRLTWKDSTKTVQPDNSILITLSELYESDQPEKALQCLLQVRRNLLDQIPDETQLEDEDSRPREVRDAVPPSLLSNIGAYQFQLEQFEDAYASFHEALAIVVDAAHEEDAESDALITTISYNLARAYDGAGLFDEAKPIYEGLLLRHAEYTDARTRLAYLELRQHPTEGPQAMAALYEKESANLDVRSMFAWFLSKAKRRTTNMAEDQEQRVYKHTLQHHDKHDQYSLTGMGNLFLTLAREMRRETEPDREKRRKTYEKAVEFYVKALQLDAGNAYAAQGVAIVMADERKDFANAVQIFSKIKDTVKDASVLINLGHVYGELKQFSRAIESYDAALIKDRGSDPHILACLGRVWLLKGKQGKSAVAMRKALEFSLNALQMAPDQIHFKFNVAFVQIQLAQLVYALPDAQRTLEEVESAAQGLDMAIESFSDIAKSKNPPYPRHDLEQRANMGRNTMRKQLERAIQQQKEYEEANAEKLTKARQLREADLRAKAEALREVQEAEEAKTRRLMDERHRLLELSRELADKRAEEERRKEEAEWTVDSEGDRVRRKRRPKGASKRKKKGGDDRSGSDDDHHLLSGDNHPPSRRKHRAASRDDDGATTDDDDDGSATKKGPRPKKRKLGRKTTNPKIKSSEMVVDSDDDDDAAAAARAATANGGGSNGAFEMDDSDQRMSEPRDAPPSEEVSSRPRKKAMRRIADDDEDEDEGEGDEEMSAANGAVSANGDGVGDGDGNENEHGDNDEDAMEE